MNTKTSYYTSTYKDFYLLNNPYGFHFNGKEMDNETYGTGNEYDYGARIYSPRLGKFFSIDPLMSKYPNESNYIFTSNNPIIYVDPDGKDKIYYFKIITQNGTVITVATKREVNNTVKAVFSKWIGDIFTGNAYLYFVDTKVDIIYDMRTKITTVSKEEKDYTKTYSLSDIMTEDGEHNKERGKQAGGWTLTSEFVTTTSDAPKTDATKGSSGSINVDLLLVAVGAAGKSNILPDIKSSLGLAELNEVGRNYKEAYDHKQSEDKKAESAPKIYCNYKDCVGKTFDAKDSNSHSSPHLIKPKK